MDLLQQAGSASLGSRFRRLSEKLVTQASQVYRAYDVPMEPSWFPVMYSLMNLKRGTVTSIAEQTGHSHPFISKTVRQLKEAGWVTTRPSDKDKRAHLLSLTDQGQAILPKLARQIGDIEDALDSHLRFAAPAFMQQLEVVESLISTTSLLEMIHDSPLQTASYTVIPYSSEYQQDFFRLNKQWIDKYFEMEASDYASLEDPDGYIIQRGGAVLLAQNAQATICATVALIPYRDNELELAKMSVSEEEQGNGLGYQIGRAAILKAKLMGAKGVFLESNRRLTPAIQLYQKLGFTELKEATPSPYTRCDIQMRLAL